MCWDILIKEEVFQSEKNFSPILHCCDGGRASWFDVALSIYEYGKKLELIQKECLINPINSSQYPSLVKRPKYSLLDCKESFELLNFRVNHWKKELYESMTKIV